MFYVSTLPKASGSPVDKDHVTDNTESLYFVGVESADWRPHFRSGMLFLYCSFTMQSCLGKHVNAQY